MGWPVGLAMEFSIRPQVGSVREELHDPSIRVEFRDDCAHGTHAPRLLLPRHGQCFCKGLGTCVDGIGIHEHRITEFPGGTGEPTEHQDTGVVISCGDEFLRDQVHPIVQASHPADVGCPQKLIHL
jgi:hypothetical protein